LGLGVPGEPTTIAAAPSAAEKQGQRIGPYKLLQKIGEGGMGTVWMAAQTEPIRRMVALKIIKSGIDSDQVLARFEVERQALALMDHPNIAKIFDAGVTSSPSTPSLSSTAEEGASKAGEGASTIPAGRPYFVMELVKGIPLLKFCDEQRLSIRERLELFMPVCQAIQHAHQKGIIHRDISPSNVLVALYDGGPVPKVIDFGIAKASGLRLTERTLFTEFGALIGKLEYMSPEQAEMNQLDIDTRSDIYSLGVLLYELLTGTTPLKRETLRQVAFDEVLRRIREEEPPRPSTRLSQTSDRLPTISAQRRLQPTQLMHTLSRDLDWIVMKALEKDRVRRYETANGLAQDVRRYLNDEPVLAGPPTTRYRLRKLLQKHRAAVAVAASFALLLIVAAIVSTGFGMRAVEARKVAETRLYHADMNLAVQALAAGNLGFARELRNVHQDDPGELKGFEWRYLWRQCRGDSAFELLGHTDAVRYLAFSPDSTTLASRSIDLAVKLWDLGSQRERFVVTNTWWLCGFAGGSNLVVAAPPDNGAVRLYDVQSGNRSRWVMLEDKPIQMLADGQTAVTIGADYTVKFWDLAKRKAIGTVPGANPGARRSESERFTTISRDGGRVAVVDDASDGEGGTHFRQIIVWDTASQQVLRQVPVEGEIQHCRFSADGAVLAVAGSKGKVWLWDASGQRAAREIPGNRARVRVIEFSPQGQILATGGSDQAIRLYDTESLQLLGSLRGHEGGIEALAFSEDGRWLASGSVDHSVRLWRMDQLPKTNLLLNLSGLQRVVFSPDGKLLATRLGANALGVWDVATLGQRATLQRPVVPLAFSSTGQGLLMAAPGQLEMMELSSQTVRTETLMHDRGIDLSRAGVLYSERGKRLAWPTKQGPLQVMDCSSGQIISIPTAKDTVKRFDFSPNGDVFVSGEAELINRQVGPDAVIRLWDARTGAMLRRLARPGGSIASLAFSPDGQMLASGTSDAEIALWDLRTGKVVRTLKGHQQAIFGLAFSPDGRNLASGSSDGTLKLWRIALDRQLDRELASLSFAGSDSSDIGTAVGWVAFSPEGNTLAALSRDGSTLRLWRAASWEEMKATETGSVR
jgi:WD40 repeat protein/serine/threonine protein kinase